MIELIIFIIATAAFAFFDIRTLAKERRPREIAAYCVICAAALAIGALYFTRPLRRGIAAYIMDFISSL